LQVVYYRYTTFATIGDEDMTLLDKIAELTLSSDENLQDHAIVWTNINEINNLMTI